MNKKIIATLGIIGTAAISGYCQVASGVTPQKTTVTQSIGQLSAQKKAVYDTLCEIIIAQLGVKRNEITLKTKFVDDLGADSLDVVEIVMAIEKQFGIIIPDEEIDKIVTIQNALDFVYDQTKN